MGPLPKLAIPLFKVMSLYFSYINISDTQIGHWFLWIMYIYKDVAVFCNRYPQVYHINIVQTCGKRWDLPKFVDVLSVNLGFSRLLIIYPNHPKPKSKEKPLVNTWGFLKMVLQVTMAFNTDSWSSMAWMMQGGTPNDKTETFISQAAAHTWSIWEVRPWVNNYSGDHGEPFSWGDYLKTLTPSCPHDCLWDACRLPASAWG
jgi:hypothetical protein